MLKSPLEEKLGGYDALHGSEVELPDGWVEGGVKDWRGGGSWRRSGLIPPLSFWIPVWRPTYLGPYVVLWG